MPEQASNTKTMPGSITVQAFPPKVRQHKGPAATTSRTIQTSFVDVLHLLSNKPLHRPKQGRLPK